jgi:hypothetical protein
MIAALLWSACGPCVTPSQVIAIADRVNEQIDRRNDALAIVSRELEAAGIPARVALQPASLVLMKLGDRAGHALAQLRAAMRRDGA